jgi:hypothetical protein
VGLRGDFLFSGDGFGGCVRKCVLVGFRKSSGVSREIFRKSEIDVKWDVRRPCEGKVNSGEALVVRWC